jgi:hypothetical protein
MLNCTNRAQILCLNFIKYYSSWLHFHLSYPYWTITSLYKNTMSSITVTLHKLTYI